jgi:hypothetical protein
MRQPEGNNFCYYPFFQVLLSANGKYKPCSKHRDTITHNGIELNTQNASIEDAWNSDYMQSMRTHFNEDKQFPGCAECWRMQKMGLRSMRYDSYQYNISKEQVINPVKPVRLELNSSNVCNLKCRLCSPWASDRWIEEYKVFYNINEKVYQNLNEKNLEQVKSWIDNLEEICFFGGEPLINKENLHLIDYLVDQGRAPHVALLFNTNGTVFNDRLAKQLSQFKRVRISFSIDDIGKRFEYQRSGASWGQVEKNIKKAYEYSKLSEWRNVEFKICCSLSIMNAYYMPDFFNYFGHHFPGLVIYWNLIYDPVHFNIQILPKVVKDQIAERWLNGIHATFEFTHEESKTVEDITTYLQNNVDSSFNHFFSHINRHDVFRTEKFSEVFPEFWNVIQEFCPSYISMGNYESDDVWKIPGLWESKYEATCDYSKVFYSRLEQFLNSNFSLEEASLYKNEFDLGLSSLLKKSTFVINSNKLFYLLIYKNVASSFWDIRHKTDTDILNMFKNFDLS